MILLTIQVWELYEDSSRGLFRDLLVSYGVRAMYISKDLAEDSMFPFKANSSVKVKTSFKLGDKKLTIEKWEEEPDA